METTPTGELTRRPTDLPPRLSFGEFAMEQLDADGLRHCEHLDLDQWEADCAHCQAEAREPKRGDRERGAGIEPPRWSWNSPWRTRGGTP